jgi:phage terminase large subunit-like protein
MARADKALLQLRGGMQPFPEAFLAMITTQSDDPPAGVFKDELEKARAVRDGERKAAVLPVLYEFPKEMQVDPAKPWKDPANWAMVTPNLGRSIELQRLIDQCREEEEKGERALRIWASQHLNIEIGLALSADGWPGAEFWEAAGDPTLTLEALLDRCEVAVMGIDGGGLDDLLGVCVLGRSRIAEAVLVPEHIDETGVLVPERTEMVKKWLHWAHGWVHPIALKRRLDIASRLQDFIKQGDLTLVKRMGDDVKAVAAIAAKINERGLFPEKKAIGVDPAGIADTVDALVSEECGIDIEQIVAVSQGWKLNGAIKTTERKVAGGQLVHGGTALMAWCAGNAKVETHGNADVVTKEASGKAKIDPLMASFNAVQLMALNPQPALDIHDGELFVA